VLHFYLANLLGPSENSNCRTKVMQFNAKCIWPPEWENIYVVWAPTPPLEGAGMRGSKAKLLRIWQKATRQLTRNAN